MQRRSFLAAGASVVAYSTLTPTPARARECMVLRIGYQNSSYLAAVKTTGELETAFAPRNILIDWVEFDCGMAMLEALGAGTIDYGYTDDSPPVLARSAFESICYVAALPLHGHGQAIVTPERSNLKTPSDLAGKRVAFARGSNAHILTIAALEHVGLRFADIEAIYLPPGEAAAAFMNGAVDAWTIWDPLLAWAELRLNAWVLAYDAGIKRSHAFFVANRRFADAHPDAVAQLNSLMAERARWAAVHRDVVADVIHGATGLEHDSAHRAVARANFEVVALTDDIIASEQRIADALHALQVVPRRIEVADAVWSPALQV